MERINVTTGTVWENKVGYSRAVKVGNQVFVSGTVAVNDNNEIVGIDNPYEQAKFIFKKIEKALIQAGSKLSDVVRTKMYVTDINDAEQIGKAHAEFFNDIKPASTMIEISKLVDPKMLVEIEVDAVIQK
ncbi:MAG: RidA family protein [Ignavibacteriae bacterium]|nr:RidA family protein [Ignavibacteriota bacterium]NOG99054.1 RidA family protein [Ignavibacteriota bacterium]